MLSLKKKVGLGILASFILAVGASLGAVFFLKPDYTIKRDELKIVGSQSETKVYKTKFEFNALAPSWKKTGTADQDHIMLRISENGRQWSEWIEVEAIGPMRDNDPTDRMFVETPIFINGRYFSFKFEDKAPEDLTMTYMDSRTPKLARFQKTVRAFLGQAEAAEQGPRIISRAEWGSPDPYGHALKGSGNFWETGYSPVKQIFVHHTVHTNYPSDPYAVVRGIWEFHTYSRGWGDIGYNYLIDNYGNRYEGRFGGDNVVGGHVFGYNVGSMGVGLIGCFQSGNSTCTQLNGGSVPAPSGTMLDSLTTLLSWKATNYEINPNTTHTFCGSEGVNYACLGLWTITGHRDAQSTSCPGNLTVDQLGNIRNWTESKKLNQPYAYSAKQLDFDEIDMSASDDTEDLITLRFKNTGTAAWSNSVNRMVLITANPNHRLSNFRGDDWLSDTVAAALQESSVPPGGTGTFRFTLKRPANAVGYFYEGFRLVSEANTELNSFFGIEINTQRFEWQLVSLSHSSGSPIMSPGQTQTITVGAKNTGTTTWEKSGTFPTHIGTWPPQRVSPFRHSSWPYTDRPALLTENTIAPGETGHFTFIVQAPAQLGEYSERYNLVSEGLSWFNDTGFSVYFNIVQGHKWQLVSLSHSTGSPVMSPGQTQTITVGAKNVGNVTWEKAGTNPVRLGTWPPQRVSPFRHASWPFTDRPALMTQDSVAPGETATFTFTVQAPAQLGEYSERFNLVAEGITWMNNAGLSVYFRVTQGHKWQLVSLSHSSGSPVMSPGQTQTITVGAKNMGTTTWVKTGSNPVRLGTWPPQRVSPFRHSSWPFADRPALMTQDTVAPGETATFTFTVQAPAQLGEYSERFNLVAEGITWMNDAGLSVYFRVV